MTTGLAAQRSVIFTSQALLDQTNFAHHLPLTANIIPSKRLTSNPVLECVVV